jgi:DNA polymerase elongation subunit (family B)
MMAEPHGKAKSLLPYFEGYEFKFGKSTYRGEDVNEGGAVYAEPGMYSNVALLDIASMHPHSAIAECIFGVEFTRRFREIVEGRVNIKHKAWDEVNKMLDGKLTPYIQKVINGEMTAKELADALKTAINAVYGQTFASYPNAFKDPRNIDNIVAKRGSLFMVELRHAVQERGFTVAHIKTDSIKIVNATPEIIQFVMDFGKRYGYTFEHEATYDRMCLVNNAVYIARYKDGEDAGKWTATGAQFQQPYVFKKLFSKEDIVIEDLCEAKEVKTAMYLNKNEGLPDGEHELRYVGKVGNFCPIKPGCGGGELVKSATDKEGNVKYDAVVGTKDYRWFEAEIVKEFNKENDIDLSYYNKLVDEAVESISQYGDFEWFVSDDHVEIVDEKLPWTMPCGKDICNGCGHLRSDKFHVSCSLGYDISDAILKDVITQ